MKRAILISVLSLCGFCITEVYCYPYKGFNFAVPDVSSVNLIYYKPIADIPIKSIQLYIFRDKNPSRVGYTQTPVIVNQESRLKKVRRRMFLGSNKKYYALSHFSSFKKYFLQLKLPP